MAKDLAKTLKHEKIQSVSLPSPLVCEETDSIQEIVERMERQRTGCALIVTKGKLIGIMTERDILTRVIEPGLDLRTDVAKVMTVNPKSLTEESSISDAIRLMDKGGHRHVPIIDASGGIRGLLSVKVLVAYLAEHFPYEVYNLPPDPHQIQRTKEGA